MTSFWEMAGQLWREFAGRLRTRRETAAIDNVAKLQDFVATRSAYVGQKTLYSYVKTRMGTRYPRMFEDDMLMASLNIAKLHVVAACVSDLTVYAVGLALHDQPVGDDARREMARRCHEAALRQTTDEAAAPFSPQDYIAEFARRLEDVDWRSGALRPENFTYSPRALLRWAPIAENLKRFDAEIVANSIKFSWRDIREQLQKRIDAEAIGADWSLQPATGP